MVWVTESEFSEAFERFGVELDLKQQDLVAKMREVCTEMEWDADDLTQAWFSHRKTEAERKDLTIAAFSALATAMRAKTPKAKAKPATPGARGTPRGTPLAAVNTHRLDRSSGMESPAQLMDTSNTVLAQYTSDKFKKAEQEAKAAATSRPMRGFASLADFAPYPEPPAKAFAQRLNSGQMMESVGEIDGWESWRAEGGSLVTRASDGTHIAAKSFLHPSPHLPPPLERYTWMFQKLAAISEANDERIEAETGRIVGDHDLYDHQVVNLTQPTQETVAIGGAVVALDKSGSLSGDGGIALEGSDATSMGRIVPVDTSRLASFSFFPGQVTVLKGRNPSGRLFQAEEQLFASSAKFFPLGPRPSDLKSLHIVAAAGPYTTNDAWDFATLYALLDQVRQSPPHLLLLFGPFLDAIDKRPSPSGHSKLFFRVLRRIGEMVESLRGITEVRLIRCSHREAFPAPLPYPSWPLSPGEEGDLELPANCAFLPDPCVLEVAGVSVALSGTDVLRHLMGAEVGTAGALDEESRLGRVVKLLLRSRSLYPLNPAAEGLHLEVAKAASHAALPQRPHLLLLPSDLKAFARRVDGVLAANPARLARGSGGGSYARLRIDLDGAPAGTASISLAKRIHLVLARI